MERLCLSAIKIGNIVIYRYDLSTENLNAFLKSSREYEPCLPTKSGNIFFEDRIILQEWEKYKVKSLDNSFNEADFIKSGEFGTESYGVLLYKNCTGLAKFKSLILEIESSKISKEEYEKLAGIVNSYICNISYDFNQASFSSVKRNQKKKTDIDYHVFLLIKNALSSDNAQINIYKNFALIENNPCRIMTSKTSYENISTVSNLSENAIIDIFSGNAPFEPYSGVTNKLAEKLTNGSEHFLPKEILCEEIVDSFDTPENRFIKYFFEWCISILSKFIDNIYKTKTFYNKYVVESVEAHIKRLKNIVSQSFLKYTGQMITIPVYSTVLTRRDGYRQLYSLFLGLKSMPELTNISSDIKEIVENKSLDVLYENFCYFGLAEIISIIYGQKINNKKFKVQKDYFSKTLEKKTNSNYFEFERTDTLPRLRIHYNKNYIVESYSKAFDPDISIEIYDKSNNLYAIYVFDAKFKMNIYESSSSDGDGEEKRKYKYDDISKMHTYRDAIKLAQGAFVLYPGTENELFFEDDKHKDLLFGVGAYSFRPNNESDKNQVKICVENLLKNYKALGC